MTAPTTPRKGAVDYGVEVTFYARHPKTGKLIHRDFTCPGYKGQPCGRAFEQTGVSRKWLEKLTPEARTEFLSGATVDEKGSAWINGKCERCSRMP